MKYEPKVGEEFPVDAANTTATTKLLREVTRSALAASVFGGSAVALIFAAGWSIISGNAGPLTTVWAVVAVPIGYVLCFYSNARPTGYDQGDKA